MKYMLILMIFAVLGYANAIGVDYTVKTCLLANVQASVKVGTSNVTFQNVGATDSGDCTTTSNKSSLLIPFKGSDNSTLNVTMNFGVQTGTVFLDELIVNYDDAGSAVTLAKAVNQPLSKSDEYYVCDQVVSHDATSNGKEATVTFTYLKVQAFGVVNSTYSAKGSVCASDSSTTGSPISTVKPTTAKPTTAKPTTVNPTTAKPTTVNPTTAKPTTAKPTTHSTAEPTTVKPIPAAKPVNGSVEDAKTGVVCILVQFTGTLTVPYTTTKGTNETYKYPIVSVKSVQGSCGNDTQLIAFKLHNNWVLSMTFAMESTKKASRRLLADGSYFMSEVKLNYDEATIPGAKGGKKVDTLTSKDLNSADVGESYKCKSGEKLTMKNGVKFDSKDMEVEAFRTEKSKDFSKNEKVCSGDLSPGSNIVPIVVGVVLALLVVIIIIAYLIGRRRTQAGYQSV